MTCLCSKVDCVAYDPQETKDLKVEPAEESWPAMFPETKERRLEENDVYHNAGDCKRIRHCECDELSTVGDVVIKSIYVCRMEESLIVGEMRLKRGRRPGDWEKHVVEGC